MTWRRGAGGLVRRGIRLGGGHAELVRAGDSEKTEVESWQRTGSSGCGSARELGRAAVRLTWLRPRPSPRSDNGGVRRPRRSAPGARGAHHLRRMLVGLRRGARRSETHNSAPRMQRGFAAAPAPRSHGAAITASPGTRLERLQGAASLAPEAGLLPLPPAATTMEPGSGVRLPRGLAGPRPRRCPAGAAQPAAICDPRAPRPALRARDGWRRPEARLPSARPARGPRAAGTRERPRPSPPRPRRRPARGPPQVMGCFPFL